MTLLVALLSNDMTTPALRHLASRSQRSARKAHVSSTRRKHSWGGLGLGDSLSVFGNIFIIVISPGGTELCSGSLFTDQTVKLQRRLQICTVQRLYGFVWMSDETQPIVGAKSVLFHMQLQVLLQRQSLPLLSVNLPVSLGANSVHLLLLYLAHASIEVT